MCDFGNIANTFGAAARHFGRIHAAVSNAGYSLLGAAEELWGIEGFFDSIGQEVAEFGIQTTLVEPGTIRTGFGNSGVVSPELGAYREGPAGMLRTMATRGYLAPGDPAKMAKVIVGTFEADAAPTRLALGQDAFRYIKAALARRLDQVEAHKILTTDCDDVQNSFGYAG